MLINGKYRCAGCLKELNTESEICGCGCNNSTVENPPHCLPIGTVLGDSYMVGKVIGEVGFGITYVGWEMDLDIKLAVKEFYMNGYNTRNSVVSTEISSCEGNSQEIFDKNKEKFINEAKLLAAFKDEPGIVSVYKFFRRNNTAYIVMEFVEGQTLKNLVRQKGKLSPEETIRLLDCVMDSLARIHKKHLIHRDISPDNIMILSDGRAKLIDFGAAREFNDGEKSLSIVLKHGFAPMEQYQTKGDQGAWTDVYALCATMYYCIGGVVPESATDRVLDDELKPLCEIDPGCDKAVSDVIMKGMAVNKKNRYQTVTELAEALKSSQKNLSRDNESKEDESKENASQTVAEKVQPNIQATEYAAVNKTVPMPVVQVREQLETNKSNSNQSNNNQYRAYNEARNNAGTSSQKENITHRVEIKQEHSQAIFGQSSAYEQSYNRSYSQPHSRQYTSQKEDINNKSAFKTDSKQAENNAASNTAVNPTNNKAFTIGMFIVIGLYGILGWWLGKYFIPEAFDGISRGRAIVSILLDSFESMNEISIIGLITWIVIAVFAGSLVCRYEGEKKGKTWYALLIISSVIVGIGAIVKLNDMDYSEIGAFCFAFALLFCYLWTIICLIWVRKKSIRGSLWVVFSIFSPTDLVVLSFFTRGIIFNFYPGFRSGSISIILVYITCILISFFTRKNKRNLINLFILLCISLLMIPGVYYITAY